MRESEPQKCFGTLFDKPGKIEHYEKRFGLIAIHKGFRLAQAESADNGKWIVLKAGRRRGEVRCQRVLTAVGRIPALDFLAPALRSALSSLVKNGWLLPAGDAVNGRCRQAAVAAGDGLRAAMEILHEVGR